MMNFLKIKTTWSNAELIVLKVCLATAYILVGAYFHNFFRSYYVPVLIAFGISMVWAVFLWINKMKKNKQD